MILTERLRRAGGQMSNACFNLGQHSGDPGRGRFVEAYTLKTLREIQQEWDSALDEAREIQKTVIEKMLKTRAKSRKGKKTHR